VLDAAVRSFAPISPLALRWAFPCWTPDHSLAPDALRGTKRARESESASRRFEEKRQKVLDFLARPEIREHGASFTTIRDGAGISNALLAVLNSLADAGLVETLESSHARTRKSIRKWRLSEMPDAGYRIDFRLNPVSGKNAGYRINPYI
jgi:hypothetical protein